MKSHLVKIVLGFCFMVAVHCHANVDSPNFMFVTPSRTDGTTWQGDRYAKCIPDALAGTNGITKIYRVGKEQDVLEATYHWYSMQTYLSGASEKTSVVRLGPSNRGQYASTNSLALEFYYDGRLLKTYSTLDMVGRGDVIYENWYKSIGGYGYIVPGSSNYLVYGFTLKTQDGRTLCFDVKTGELVKDGRPEFEK